MTTVGTGKYSYSLVQDWAKMPQGETFGTVSAVATDSQDRVYVFQRKDPPVQVFDRDGNHRSSWGSGQIKDPHGFSIVDDVVYCTDREDSVALKFTLDGQLLQTLGQRGVHSDTACENPGDLAPRVAGPFNYPTEMVPGRADHLFVTDGYRNARVHEFLPDGQIRHSWGRPGKAAPYEFHLPHSLVCGPRDMLYVCDRENSRVQVFSFEGTFMGIWSDMQRPQDISIDKDGVFYTCERDEEGKPPQVSVLDQQGKVLARWPSRGAHGLWVDSHGDIYLALTGEKSVDKYVRQG